MGIHLPAVAAGRSTIGVTAALGRCIWAPKTAAATTTAHRTRTSFFMVLFTPNRTRRRVLSGPFPSVLG